jgi:asparagine synthase (glutamine-hydrolysing)
MSGIYGIINLKGNPVDTHQMDKMESLLIHRGIDGKAQWIDKQVGLGHLKLEITLESEYEQLPLEYKNWVITADARIDNRDELDGPLSIEPSEKHKIPDINYIVKAYEKWGKDCVKYLIGDFAFAIWDKNDETLFCARDHIGIKPFFYLKTDNKFIFASELKTIVELREIPVELNESKLGDWMYRIQDLHNPTDTLFMNIKRLMPAHKGILKNEGFDIQQYWKLERKKEIKLPSDEAYAEKLRDLMIQAVECRMRTKYDIGVTLSGGLDSSSIACIAARKLAKEGKNLYTASSVLPDNWEGIEEDEREYIEAIVEQEKNIIPSYAYATDNDVFDNLEASFEKYYLPLNPFFYMDLALDKALLINPNLRVKMNGFYGDIAVSHKGRLVLPTLIRKLNFTAFLKLLRQRLKLENSVTVVFKEAFSSFIPKKVKKIINNLRGFDKIEDKAFHLVVADGFIKKYQLKKLSEKYTLKKEKCQTVSDQIALNTHSVLHALEEINIRTSFLGIEELNPLADIRILEYLINSPVEQFNHKGWLRGWIRFAMSGILPIVVQWRKNKCMYVPSFRRQIFNSSNSINKILDSDKAPLVSNYINISNINRFLPSVRIVKNWQDPKIDNSTIIFSIGLINFMYLDFLFKKNIIITKSLKNENS